MNFPNLIFYLNSLTTLCQWLVFHLYNDYLLRQFTSLVTLFALDLRVLTRIMSGTMVLFATHTYFLCGYRMYTVFAQV